MTVAHEKPVARSLSSAEIGVLLAIGAHLVWGGMAVYFGHIRYISPMEIAVNRGVWALPIAAAVVWYMGQWRDVWRAVKNPKHLAILALTAGLIVAAAALTPGASARGAVAAVRRDAGRHRSPNAGWPEAAMAGALGLRLAGPRVYGATRVEDAWMGSGRAEAGAGDIARALVVYRRACLLLWGLAAGLAGIAFLT